jgi:hypothetical protein
MTFRAFIVGINTTGLKYCNRDASLIKEALSNYGYEIYLIDEQEKKHEILQNFENMLGECLKIDTVIFYFSGHGMVDRGELFLITKGNGSDEFSKIPVIDILGPLSRSLAKDKLIILDCCHAGKIAAMWNNPEPSDVYRVLIAANPLQNAKEIDDLGASFLTYHIHFALTNPSKEILDDGKIKINNLSKWLRKQADLHNCSSSIKVPHPYFIGSDKADFEVCILERSLIKPMAVETVIDDNRLINEIKEWKVIHTKSQSIQDYLATMIKFLDISRIKSDDFVESLDSVEYEWTQCAPFFREIQYNVKRFHYIKEEEAVQLLLPYADKIFIKNILDRIRIAKSYEDALDIKRSIADIKQDIDNGLHIADLQIVRLVDELAIKWSTKIAEENHVNTEA